MRLLTSHRTVLHGVICALSYDTYLRSSDWAGLLSSRKSTADAAAAACTGLRSTRAQPLPAGEQPDARGQMGQGRAPSAPRRGEADAGEDKTISAEEDNTATILLDGSRSYDPDGMIQSYAWQDSKGNVIGDSVQVRVRLPLGTHPFELTVVDDKGAATKAMVTVRIQ